MLGRASSVVVVAVARCWGLVGYRGKDASLSSVSLPTDGVVFYCVKPKATRGSPGSGETRVIQTNKKKRKEKESVKRGKSRRKEKKVERDSSLGTGSSVGIFQYPPGARYYTRPLR